MSRARVDTCTNLTIGIDASRVREGSTGVGRYTQSLLKPLDQVMPDANFVLFAKREYNIPLPSERWAVVCDDHALWCRLPVTFWIHYRLGYLIREKHIDVLWAVNSFIPGKIARSVPSVVTVFDLRHVLYPRDMPPVTWLAHKLWFGSSLRRARSVMAISQGTSDRMQHILGRNADVIVRPSVPPLPAINDPIKLRRILAALGVRTPFLLTVGNSPCKNLPAVVAAVGLLKSKGLLSDHQLVMVGPSSKVGRAAVAEPQGRNWIKKLGRVTDTAMFALYASADVLVFPSIYEGFGIPVLEARSVGCRVVTTDSPELREAGGDDTVYVEPTRDGVASGIERALHLPHPRAVPAVTLTWSDAARTVAHTLRAAVGSVE